MPTNSANREKSSEEKSSPAYFFLTIEFRNQYYYWTSIELLIQFLLIFISKLVTFMDQFQKNLVLLLCFLLMSLIYQITQPFNKRVFSNLTFISFGVVVLCIGANIVSSREDANKVERLISKGILVGTNAGFYFMIVYLLFKNVFMENKQIIKKLQRRSMDLLNSMTLRRRRKIK